MKILGLEIKKAQPKPIPREWLTPTKLNPALKILRDSDNSLSLHGFWSVVWLAIPETSEVRCRVKTEHATGFTIQEIIEA